MSAVVADTHDDPRLSDRARAAIDEALTSGEAVYISAITPIEIAFLVDKGRMKQELLNRLLAWVGSGNKGLLEVPVSVRLVPHLQAIPRQIVPDMPDRIIAATARHLDLPLVTCDSEIRRAPLTIIW